MSSCAYHGLTKTRGFYCHLTIWLYRMVKDGDMTESEANAYAAYFEAILRAKYKDETHKEKPK